MDLEPENQSQAPKELKGVKKFLAAFGLAILVLLFLAITSAFKMIFNNSDIGNSSVDSKSELIHALKMSSRELNAKCPLDYPGIRLDSTSVGPEAQFNYYYTLITETSAEGAYRFRKENKSGSFIKSVCENKEQRKVIDYGGVYRYVYLGTDGMQSFSISINKLSCENAARQSLESP